MSFSALLRQLRIDAGLTQEELAEAATLSSRSVSDLERGINQTARKETARLLADALGLAGPARAAFEAAARGRNQPSPSPARVAAGVGLRAGAAAATRTLPRDIGSFTGRGLELAALADAAAARGAVVGIHAIGGMAGIGKTTFAVHAAHQLAPRFPDGQVFLPLHGHTPGQQPVDPADALASLLQTVGVTAAQVPVSLEARMALWRDHLADKKLLLLLDDAIGSDQVRPLLPGSAGSMVLVTSRRHLTALEDAQAISLDTLAPEEAASLFIRLCARPGLDPLDSAVGKIIALCGYLPLAIGMQARQLHHHPSWTPAELAGDLAAARDRLELMQAENVSVAAAFDLSYRDLTPDEQRMFRRLGLHPGTDVDAWTAAALDGSDLGAARRRLLALYDHYLLAEPARGRYRLHDLIREHSRALAGSDSAADQEAARGRLLDYYLATARAAGEHLPRRNPALLPEVTGTPPGQAPDLSAREAAVSWLDVERFNLHAAVGYAAAHRWPGHAAAIPAAMHGYLRFRGHWDQALALHNFAIGAAHQAGDHRTEAGALTDLGDIQHLMADYPAATATLTRALELCRDLGNELGEAGALYYLGAVQRLTGDYAAAAASLTRALELYVGLGNQLGEANALNYLGAIQYLTGKNAAAAASLSQALELYRDLGHRNGEANVLNYLGAVQQADGDHAAAIASQERALELFCELGNRLGEANALNYLGSAQQQAGDNQAATVSLNRALELYRDLGARDGEPEVLNVLGELALACGALADAHARYERARAIAADIGSPLEEARALEGIGRCHLRDGQPEQAGAPLRRALELYQRIGSPGTERVQATLQAHNL